MNRVKTRPTIKDVAKASGVSAQTVSRVVNNRPDVADDTRERVKKVIKDIGYQPSALARSLIRKESLTLGIVTAGLKHLGPSRTLNGITGAAEEAGYSLLLKELPNYNATDIVPIINELRSRHVDGIIWAAPEIGDNRDWVEEFPEQGNMPFVYLTMEPRDSKSIISVDNHKGGTLAVEHLIENGYTKIGHIAGPLDWWESCQRFKAWKEIVSQDSDFDVEQYWTEGNWSSRSGMQAMKALFKKAPDLDAVFVGNDQMALGALMVIRERGLRVPEDIGIVGFDNISESEFFAPPLTTIQHNHIEVGALAVEEIIRLITAVQHNRKPNYRVQTLEPALLVRKSSVKEVERKRGGLESMG
jgi:DNA-binding LacI/PurR family transcriptional regulator